MPGVARATGTVAARAPTAKPLVLAGPRGWRSGAARRCSAAAWVVCPAASSPQRALDRLARDAECLVELLGIAAAGLRHRVAPAATAAGDLRRELDDVAGVQP